jgi:hypothetical protein
LARLDLVAAGNSLSRGWQLREASRQRILPMHNRINNSSKPVDSAGALELANCTDVF